MAKKGLDLAAFGHYAFIVGLIIAVLISLVPSLNKGNLATVIMVALGIIVGLLNVTAKESTGFLVATIALVMATTASVNVLSWSGWLEKIPTIFGNIILFVAPAAVVVSIKSIYELAKA